jgi:hypothetical protein
MAEYYLTTFDDLLKQLSGHLKEVSQQLTDFQTALKTSTDPNEIINQFECRVLMRQMENDRLIH